MKRLTRDWARCTVFVSYDKFSIPNSYQIAKHGKKLWVYSCLALNRLTVYERMLGGFVLASKGG
jgi:hypothetical protein